MAGKSALAPLTIALAVLTAAPGGAQEAVHVMDRDIFAAGAELRVSGNRGGDLIAAGGNLDIQAGGALDVVAAGGEVYVSGAVGEDALLAGGSVTLSGEVAEDLILAGGQIRIERGARIGDDARIAGGDVRLDGDVGGDVAMVGGRLAIGGTVGGDVEAAGGRLEILPGARIAGAVRFRGEEAPVVSPQATIGGEVDFIAGRVYGRGWDDDRGLGWGGGLWLALAMIATGIVVMLLIPGIAGRAGEVLRSRPVASALIGLAVLIGMPILVMLLMATVIGIPLAVIVLALYPATLFTGFVVAAFALSDWALRRRVGAPSPLQRFGAFALTVAVLFIAYAIPWIGGWLVLATLLLGLGALGQAVFAARGQRPATS